MQPHEIADAADKARVYPGPKDREAMAAYRQQGYDIRDQFSADLSREYLPNEARHAATKIFDKAWSDGHSEGYHRVEEIYEEIADIVRVVVDGLR
ncbi:hypothetical protein [Terracoccus sp. 273MFTsu3.1]|uniref:hypothetical protein n=1 Tax=Terracoccus sp. 273MFTsu3.1 TaxID=1172188 RepID=UPI000382A999|nr:hypothetical protein [Terracoccus sp. 273MFTsu3.1]